MPHFQTRLSLQRTKPNNGLGHIYISSFFRFLVLTVKGCSKKKVLTVKSLEDTAPRSQDHSRSHVSFVHTDKLS